MTRNLKEDITLLSHPDSSGAFRVGLANLGGSIVSIVRIGLAETHNFASGYEAIFGGKASVTKKKSAGAKPKSGKSKSAKKKKK
jgi:hypothetical protein